MTGQSLFYLGEGDLKHKILAIAEEEGVRQAAYALKLLQSQGELTIASTGKDPQTGKLVTSEYRVQGPVMLCLTSTAIDIDEELLNRCLVLTINETAEQTRRSKQRQRQARTLTGLRASVHSEQVLAAHRAAQTLLRPLAVVNPLAESLTFAHDRVRLRRDHQKYLALIDAIALLHQYQRTVHTLDVHGTAVEYVEVTGADIALANRLAHAVLGRSLDELPPQTRRVLAALDAWVSAQADSQDIGRELVRFTRRAVRSHLGCPTRNCACIWIGSPRSITWRCTAASRGSASATACCLTAMPTPMRRRRWASIEAAVAPTSRGKSQPRGAKSPTSRGENPNLAGGSRPGRGGVAGRSRGSRTPLKPKPEAVCSGSASESSQTHVAGPAPDVIRGHARTHRA